MKKELSFRLYSKTTLMIILMIGFLGMHHVKGQTIPMPLPGITPSNAYTLLDHHAMYYDLQSRQSIFLDSINHSFNQQTTISETLSSKPSFFEVGDPDNFGPLFLVTNTTVHPYNKIVRIVSSWGINGMTCSGALIGFRRVLTACHCLYNQAFGGWANSVFVYPGYNNGIAPYGYTHGTTVLNWGYENKDDIAVLALYDDIGKQTGHLGFGYSNNNSYYTNNQFYNQSYPGQPFDNSERMYTSVGNFDNVSEYFVYFNRQSYGGMSGSPMYHADNNIIAVLRGGEGNLTECTRITYSKFLDIQNFLLPQPGILEVNNSNLIKIYPNPAEDEINIKLVDSYSYATISIINLYGNSLYEVNVAPLVTLIKIPISNFKPGFYIIHLNNGTNLIKQSFVKM
jgi:V8-like Glu-specific endopeptidase